ncbi:hypothetical protein DSM3645_30201 [Blastopirellula marina DSM 3645]|uniref:Uncharacterized protein n=1 Tax=Blastopirellula marina DSM 3645 TaxID=314230 RepID=A3ZX94_9BACT|nr:hypothetical protein DSM3645_30201 [Blastopirellula marina DSM 3645]
MGVILNVGEGFTRRKASVVITYLTDCVVFLSYVFGSWLFVKIRVSKIPGTWGANYEKTASSPARRFDFSLWRDRWIRFNLCIARRDWD